MNISLYFTLYKIQPPPLTKLSSINGWKFTFSLNFFPSFCLFFLSTSLGKNFFTSLCRMSEKEMRVEHKKGFNVEHIFSIRDD